MASYQRFQVLSAARQDLFSPESPVWVSRYQLSRDLESGKRLLQTRMVNCSEKVVRQVFLRVVCLGANRERLTQLEMIPMQTVSARPGRIFGDDKLVELPDKGAVYAEVFAQRVRFADGSTWDEPDPLGYLAFSAVPVRRQDPHYETLETRARSGNVRNDCYFRTQQGLWVCTCGLPNAIRSLRCARCGAERLWLEAHMDPNLIDAPAPVKTPAPAPDVYSPPAPSVTVVPAPFREETVQPPTIIVQSPPEPEPDQPRAHPGRIAAIVAAVMVFLAVGAFCTYHWLMPYLRYQEAMRERAAGNYDRAVTIFEELGEYQDSVSRITETLNQKAQHLMGEGDYQQALEILEAIGGADGQIADCLYSLGVLAYNAKDVSTALDYVAQLRARFPNYDKTESLAQYCYYSQGNQLAESATAEADPDRRILLFEDAKDSFAQAGGYEDSADRIRECDYRIALAYKDKNELPEAVERLRALGDYQLADEQRRATMYQYATERMDAPDSLCFDYLQELADAGYQDAQDLLNRLNGVGFAFEVRCGGENVTDPVTDLSEVSVHYNVELRDDQGAVLVLVCYELPDGTQGRGLLNTDRSAYGYVDWVDFPFPATCAVGGPVTLRFYDATRGENTEPLDTIVFTYAPQAEPPESGSQTDPGAPSPGTGG